jgi:uncharacterized protein involved in exopolysaccharide biosynthesis
MIARSLFILIASLLCASIAAAQSTTPRVDVELAARLAEVEADVSVLEQRYGPRHPQLVEARRRLAYLRAGAAKAPSVSSAHDHLRSWLQRRIGELRRRQAELLTRYGRAHPAVLEVGQRLAVFQRHLQGIGGGAVVPSRRGELLVQQAENEGRLAFLTTRYGASHPAVMAARAAIDAARGAMQQLGQANDAERAEARLLFLEALARARGRRAAQGGGERESGELDAAIDALALHVALLGPPAPTVPPRRKR